MMTENKIELHIPSVIGFEKVAMECAASVAKKMGFTEDRIEDLKTAVAEACLNAIEHGGHRCPSFFCCCIAEKQSKMH
jgi:serine/threonine-protein kinase RsbW